MAGNVESIVNLPIIDVSSRDIQAAKDIINAASTYGFVFIKGYGSIVSDSSVDEMFTLARQFFKAPQDLKAQVSINSNKSGKNKGWLSMHTETLDPAKQKRGDFKEAFNIGEYVNGQAQQPLVSPLEEAEAQIGTFQQHCHQLCNRVLQLFALGLEINSNDGGLDWFSLRHDRLVGPSGSVLRLLYYPRLPLSSSYDPSIDIRAGAHSDYGSITLLFQLPGQPGLEILTSNRTWAPVPVIPGTILINIGDLLSHWTNGLLKSTVHRVIGPKDAQERYSIAYFCHPIDDAELVPVPSELVAQAGKERGTQTETALTAKEHLNRRLAATYGLKSKE